MIGGNRMKYRNIIFKTVFGSTLYGTRNSNSDFDYKTIYAPRIIDLIHGNVKLFSNYHETNKEDKHSKSCYGIIENEVFTIHNYLKQLCSGQTCAIDILFAPQEFWIPTWDDKVDPFWEDFMFPNRTGFVTKQLNTFVLYCVKQVAKYGLKGGRINTAEKFVEYFESIDPNTKLYEIIDKFNFKDFEHCSFIEKDSNIDSIMIVCGKKFHYNTRVRYIIDPLKKFLYDYGYRARLAALNEGVDFKACSHAFRAAYEVKELVETRNLEFPLKDRVFLTKIKNGEIPYKEFAPMLEDLVDEVYDIVINSDLPEDSFYSAEKLIDIYYNFYYSKDLSSESYF